MCTSPFWRWEVSQFTAEMRGVRNFKGYKDGAFVFSKKNVEKLEYLTTFLAPYLDKLHTIPCGKCLECKVANSREWAQRAVAESMCSDNNYFITLTYDDEHLLHTFKDTISRTTGEKGFFPCLLKSDFQGFMKRLRSKLEYNLGVEGIRFMACGEYGPKNGRPHFHTILYNCPLDDIETFKEVNIKGKSYVYQVSKTIEEAWGKGFITIGEVNFDTSAYVARYVLKKFTGNLEHDYLNACAAEGVEPQEPEFRLASRRPGLGRPFYEQHKDDIYKYDKVLLNNGKMMKPCSYFDNLYDLENPELLEELKLQRQRRAALRQVQELKGVKDIEAYNRNKSEKFERSIKKLVRTL